VGDKIGRVFGFNPVLKNIVVMKVANILIATLVFLGDRAMA